LKRVVLGSGNRHGTALMPPISKEHSAKALLGSISGDRVGLSAVIASTPTTEMRAELENAGVALPGADELTELSKQINEWLENWREVHGHGHSVTWHNLFTEVDVDGSGFITYDELTEVIRQKLRKSEKAFSGETLKALWCALDVDSSDRVDKDEMAAFFKRGAPAVHRAQPKQVKKEHTAKALLGSISGDRVGLNNVIASTPTTEMRAELEQAGISLPAGDELTEFSKQINEWLENWRELHGMGHSITWHNLFREVDVDGSGFITYDEFTEVIRQKLKKSEKAFSGEKLKALWCALDVDLSDRLTKDEMAAFFKRGAPAKYSVGPKQIDKEHSAKTLLGSISGDRVGMSAAIASTPTKEMLAELEQAGISLPDDDELTELSKQINEWLENWRELHGLNRSVTWHNLYREVDVDGSGFITYDEFTEVIRQKLKKSEKAMSSKKLKALWCALDVDLSDRLTKDEMAAFFKRGAPAVHRAQPKQVNKEHSAKALLGAISGDRVGTGRALASKSTTDMRAELDKLGVPLLDPSEQLALSQKFAVWIEAARYDDGKAKSTSWYSLFKAVDNDGSGFITFDEFCKVVRTKLRVKKEQLTDRNIKTLWVTLDADDSDQLLMDEFANFLKGKPAVRKQKKKAKPKVDDADDRRLTAAESAERKRRASAEYNAVCKSLSPGAERKANSESRRQAEEQASVVREERERARDEEHRKMLRAKAARQSRKRVEEEAARLAAQRQVDKAERTRLTRCDLLYQMRISMLASPIALDNGRLGSTRIVPIYQSERILHSMEHLGVQQAAWPLGRSRTPPPMQNMFVNEISRLDDLQQPSWVLRMKQVQASSRPTTPTLAPSRSLPSVKRGNTSRA